MVQTDIQPQSTALVMPRSSRDKPETKRINPNQSMASAVFGIKRFPQAAPAEKQTGDQEWDVDEKDPSPSEGSDQNPTSHRPQSQPESVSGEENAHRLAPLFLGKGIGDDCRGRRVEGCDAGSLDEAASDHLSDREGRASTREATQR